MKKILFSTLTFFNFLINISAQNFEGVLTWSIKGNLGEKTSQNMSKFDKSEMDEAQKQMMEQMNNPEIANNPQAKEMLEKMMKQMQATQGAIQNGAAGLIPTGMIIKLKNGNSLVSMQGGVSSMIGDILYIKSKNETYSVKKSENTYTKLPESKESAEKINVINTREKSVILGYNCLKYIVDNAGTKQTIYATTEIKDIDVSVFRNVNSSKNDSYSNIFSKIDGVPLKIEVNSPEANITMECISIKKQTLMDSEFIIPSNYKESKSFGF